MRERAAADRKAIEQAAGVSLRRAAGGRGKEERKEVRGDRFDLRPRNSSSLVHSFSCSASVRWPHRRICCRDQATCRDGREARGARPRIVSIHTLAQRALQYKHSTHMHAHARTHTHTGTHARTHKQHAIIRQSGSRGMTKTITCPTTTTLTKRASSANPLNSPLSSLHDA